jgi:hypothetical protein
MKVVNQQLKKKKKVVKVKIKVKEKKEKKEKMETEKKLEKGIIVQNVMFVKREEL